MSDQLSADNDALVITPSKPESRLTFAENVETTEDLTLENLSIQDDDVPVAPSSGDTGGRRNYTPVRVRPHSQPRGAQTSLEQVGAVVAPLRERARHVGRRKERRWENDHLVVARQRRMDARRRAISAPRNRLFVENNFDMEDDVEMLSGRIQVEWKSNFEELTSKDGASLRDKFINCDTEFLSKRRAPVRRFSEKAEEQFTKIDRKIRHHLVTTGSKPRFQRFISTLEEFIVLTFSQTSEYVDLKLEKQIERLYESLKPMLNKSWSMQKSSLSILKKKAGTVSSLKLCFKSGIYRILAHGVCEFHGLSSSSFDGPGGKRITRIQSSKELGKHVISMENDLKMEAKQVLDSSLATYLKTSGSIVA